MFLSCLALIWSLYVQAICTTSQKYSCLRPQLRHCSVCHKSMNCFVKFQVDNKPFICFRQLDHKIYRKKPFTAHTLARIQSGFITELIHKYFFIKYIFILCYDQQMYNYLKSYYTPTCFHHTVILRELVINTLPCYTIFRMQSFVIQFTIKTITRSLRMARQCRNMQKCDNL